MWTTTIVDQLNDRDGVLAIDQGGAHIVYFRPFPSDQLLHHTYWKFCGP